jgi:Zn-dependent protease
MGHVLFAKAEGVKTTLPLFLGPLGALIFLRSQVRDARQEAIIAIGGPLVGTLGAIACALLAAGATGSTRLLLIALAYFGFFINLINLLPLAILDGASVWRSTRWLWYGGGRGKALVSATLYVATALALAVGTYAAYLPQHRL